MTFTAVSIVMSTLLASPRVEALVPSFGGRGFNMVSALIPPHGRAANSTPFITAGGTPTGPARVFDGSRGHPKRSPTGTAAAAPPSGDADDAHREQQHHPASAVYFDDVDGHAEPSQLLGSPCDQRDLPAGPPEPGGGVDQRHRAQQLESSQRSGALPAAYRRPWRQRARDARRQTVFENNPEEGFEAEEGGGGLVGARRRRASEKEEVVASRKDSQQKAINRAALPIVDLVGLVSPLVLIAGMTMVHIVP